MTWQGPGAEPELGAFGVVHSNGKVALAIRVGTQSRANHAFIYVGDGKIIEADGSGVQLVPAAKYPTAIYDRRFTLTLAQGAEIRRRALLMQGTPYSFIGIFVMSVGCLGLPNRWLATHLEHNGRVFCSQLVCQVYSAAGVHLFADDRLPGQVSPGDLAELAFEQAEA